MDVKRISTQGLRKGTLRALIGCEALDALDRADTAPVASNFDNPWCFSAGSSASLCADLAGEMSETHTIKTGLRIIAGSISPSASLDPETERMKRHGSSRIEPPTCHSIDYVHLPTSRSLAPRRFLCSTPSASSMVNRASRSTLQCRCL